MGRLITTPNISGVDDVYDSLVGLTAGLGEVESLRVQAKLILLLANHAGDREAVEEAISLCRSDAS